MPRGRVQTLKKLRHGKREWSRKSTQDHQSLIHHWKWINKTSSTSSKVSTIGTRRQCTLFPADGQKVASSTYRLISKITTSSSVILTEWTHSEETMRSDKALVYKVHNTIPKHHPSSNSSTIRRVVAHLWEGMQEGRVKLPMGVSSQQNSSK